MITKILFQIFRSELFPRGLQIRHYASSEKEVIEFFNKKMKNWGVDYVLKNTDKDSLNEMCDSISNSIKANGGIYVGLTQMEAKELCLSMITDLTQVQHNAELLAPIASQMEIILKQALKR